MKAILVIDMPYYCCTCPFFRFKYRDDYDSKETVCTINGYINENGIDTIASWCPLKPMPKEEDIYEVGMDEEDTRAKQQWNKGWNACLEELEKPETKSNLSTDEGWWKDYELYEMQND